MGTNKGNITTIVLVLITTVAIAMAAYILVQNKKLSSTLDNSEISVEISTGPNVENLQLNIEDEGGQASLPPVQPAPTSVVVFEASGSIPSVDKVQLMERIVEPFVDYYNEHGNERHLVSLSISKNTGASVDLYPYQAKAIFSDGVNSGFLIAKKEGSIDWWLPECMQCVFSPQFSKKYPFVVSRFNQ